VATPGKTVGDELARVAQAYGDRPFLHYGDDLLSFTELERRTRSVAAGAVGLGWQRGDHVALFMGNRTEFVLAWLGLSRIGIVVVPVNGALVGDGLTRVLKSANCAGVIVEPELQDRLVEARDHSRLTCPVVVTGDDGGAHLPWAALEHDDSGFAEVAVSPRDPMMMMFTSGTTGDPKGLLVPHQRFGGGRYILRAAGITGDDRAFTCLPMFHGNAALISFAGSLSLGIELTVARRFSASRFWDQIRQAQATTFNTLGTMISILGKNPPRDDDADNPVRLALSAACPKDLWVEFQQRFGLDLVEFYGTMEGGMTMTGPGAPVGSIGKPSLGFRMRIARPDGSECEPDEVGELLSQPEAGPASVDYYNNPRASASKVRDGWLYTGDRVYADQQGWLFFVDRADHLIRRRGENISSTEIEEIANRHPQVLESAAYALPSELGEDDVALAVLPIDGATVDPQDVFEHCRTHLGAYQLPRYITVVERLPKTETHRVQKGVLRKAGVQSRTWDSRAANSSAAKSSEAGG
jgi:carnitine-CoA ligase